MSNAILPSITPPSVPHPILPYTTTSGSGAEGMMMDCSNQVQVQGMSNAIPSLTPPSLPHPLFHTFQPLHDGGGVQGMMISC